MTDCLYLLKHLADSAWRDLDELVVTNQQHASVFKDLPRALQLTLEFLGDVGPYSRRADYLLLLLICPGPTN
jgi:hypothetical protein